MALSLKKKKEGEVAEAPKEKSRAARKPREGKVAKAQPKKVARVSKGSKRFVLIIGDEGAILIFMHGAKVVRRLFAPSPQPSHTEAIVEIMTTNPSVPIYVLADVLDQQYVPHTFPPVSSLSVGGLVKRRLDRDFQPEDLKGSLPIGRDKTGRKEWKFLLVALAKTPLLSDWIDRLVELPNEFKGIYLVPIEAVNYIAMLRGKLSDEKPKPWQLLISHNKVSGFRQIVTHEGRLVFTRVSQAIDDAIPAVIAGNIEQEIINTVEYLKRLEFRDNADLDATVIVSQDVLETLDLKRFGFAHHSALTPMQVSEVLELEQAALSADRFGDVVMAAGFGVAKKRLLRFSTSYVEQLAKLYKARLAIIGVAAVICLGLIAGALLSLATMASDYQDISTSEKKLSALQPELQKMRKAVDGLNQDVAFKSAVVATYDAYLKNAPQPEDFVSEMMPLIAPARRVINFEWENTIAKSGAAKPANPGPGGQQELPIKIKMDVDFSGGGNKLEQIDKSSTEFTESLKSKLTGYEVSNEPFPWIKDQSQASETFEINAASAVTVTNTIGIFNLRGVKTSPPGATPPPAGTP